MSAGHVPRHTRLTNSAAMPAKAEDVMVGVRGGGMEFVRAKKHVRVTSAKVIGRRALAQAGHAHSHFLIVAHTKSSSMHPHTFIRSLISALPSKLKQFVQIKGRCCLVSSLLVVC